VFIFFCEKENEPKEIALVPRPFGLPCASYVFALRASPPQARWPRAVKLAALKQSQRLPVHFCDASVFALRASPRHAARNKWDWARRRLAQSVPIDMAALNEMTPIGTNEILLTL
jgi:hypothetical protein